MMGVVIVCKSVRLANESVVEHGEHTSSIGEMRPITSLVEDGSSTVSSSADGRTEIM